MNPKLESYFETHNIEYKEYKHKEVFTVEESRELKKDIPGLAAKCLFLKSDKGDFYLVGMSAEKRLDIKALQQKLEVKKLRFASPEELKSELDLTPGSVSIFGMINSTSVTFILDNDIWLAEQSGFHPNINTSTLVLDKENLEKFYNSLPNKKMVLDL
jgi:Ala-tRNA(Pro) deacylase